jgi:ATP-dependent Clp protease ATP-binding subunit ClpX
MAKRDGTDQNQPPTDPNNFRGRKVTTCSFCGKTSREVGPMVEGPNSVYVCSGCTDLCQNIFKQEKRRVSSATTWLREIPAPREILMPAAVPEKAPVAIAG